MNIGDGIVVSPRNCSCVVCSAASLNLLVAANAGGGWDTMDSSIGAELSLSHPGSTTVHRRHPRRPGLACISPTSIAYAMG
jgi:hypothetical protein